MPAGRASVVIRSTVTRGPPGSRPDGPQHHVRVLRWSAGDPGPALLRGPRAGVEVLAGGVAQRRLVAGVVPDVVPAAPVDVAAAVRALAGAQPDAAALGGDRHVAERVHVVRRVADRVAAEVDRLAAAVDQRDPLVVEARPAAGV